MPYATTWKDLKDIFRDSRLVRADILTDRDGRSKGCGIIIYDCMRDAMQAIEKYDGIVVHGRKVEVREVLVYLVFILGSESWVW